MIEAVIVITIFVIFFTALSVLISYITTKNSFGDGAYIKQHDKKK